MRSTPPEAAATRRLQQAFLADLTRTALRTGAEREAVFARPPRGTVADRWHVYAHGYAARLTEALGLEYAAIAGILGPEAFGALVARYAAVFPPRSFDLANAGDRLAHFLEFDGLTAELPFLPDLARLERAVALCFTAADAVPLDWEGLRRSDPAEIATRRLGLAPGVRLVESSWPIVDLWATRFEEDLGAVSIPLEGRTARALVFRRDGRVRVEPVSEAEAALVEAAGPGVTLDDLMALSGTADDDVPAMLEAFRGLVERGIFVHLRSAGWTGALELSMEESR